MVASLDTTFSNSTFSDYVEACNMSRICPFMLMKVAMGLGRVRQCDADIMNHRSPFPIADQRTTLAGGISLRSQYDPCQLRHKCVARSSTKAYA